MPDAYTTFAATQNDAPNVWIAAETIELLERMLVMNQIGEQFSLESGNGKTMRIVRIKRVALPFAPAVDGVTPSTNALEVENVDVTVEQWVLVVALTDQVELTVRHPMLKLAIERVALAMKETSEREDANVLMGASNVTFPGSVTTRGALTATDVFNTAMAITMRAKLKMRGAPAYNRDQYKCLMQPPHEAALLASDTVFQQASNFAKQERLEYGYIGTWMGLDCIVGNFLPMFVGVATPTTAATTATKAQFTVGTSGTLATANFQLQVVGRELVSDYERRLSVQTGNIAVTSPGSIAVTMPTSVNYSYDVYMTQAGGTVPFLVASRQAANSTFTITTAPAGTERVAPPAPALGVSVYPGFVVGKSAFGVCKLNGMSLQTFVTPKGATDSDPAAQRRKVAAKYMRKAVILDSNYIERFETSSSLAAFVPV